MRVCHSVSKEGPPNSFILSVEKLVCVDDPLRRGFLLRSTVGSLQRFAAKSPRIVQSSNNESSNNAAIFSKTISVQASLCVTERVIDLH